LQNLWTWLPAFRTVAETQHLPSAARALNVTPSAVSRSIRHLEDAIGQELFTREERRIKLNRNGEILFDVLREAMLQISDGLDQVSSSSPSHLSIASPSTWLQLLVLPVVHQSARRDVALAVQIVSAPIELRNAALLRGSLDLVLEESHHAVTGLAVECLGLVEHAVYHGCDDHARAAELPFAVFSDGYDPWPLHRPRQIGLWSPHFDVVLQECLAGRMRAVLPTAVARRLPLTMLRDEPLPPSRLYLTRRHTSRRTHLDGFVDDLLAQARAVLPPDVSATAAADVSATAATAARAAAALQHGVGDELP
jgi:DNA-binding transcriptional LysR family regulator